MIKQSRFYLVLIRLVNSSNVSNEWFKKGEGKSASGSPTKTFTPLTLVSNLRRSVS